MKISRTFGLLALAVLLAVILESCGTPGTAPTISASPADSNTQATLVAAQVAPHIAGTATAFPTITAPTATVAEKPAEAQSVTLTCADQLEKVELREPYRRDKRTNAPRFTYSREEWQSLLSEIGVASICIPVQLGAPYLVNDWDAAKKTAQAGRMITVGFQASANDAPEMRGWLVYSTYNIAAPTEYDRFSMPEDWDAVKRGVQTGLFEVAGAKGFARAMPSAYSFGTTTIYQTYVIPSETSYVALVYNLGAYEGDLQGLVEKFNAGAVPAEYKTAVELFAATARTIQLK